MPTKKDVKKDTTKKAAPAAKKTGAAIAAKPKTAKKPADGTLTKAGKAVGGVIGTTAAVVTHAVSAVSDLTGIGAETPAKKPAAKAAPKAKAAAKPAAKAAPAKAKTSAKPAAKAAPAKAKPAAKKPAAKAKK